MSTVSGCERNEVEIIIDGSCLGNPGPGGWACILRYGEYERVLQGGVPDATNNRMELAAAISGTCLRAELATTDFLSRTYQSHSANSVRQLTVPCTLRKLLS